MIFDVEPYGLPCAPASGSTPQNAINAYFRDHDVSDKITDGNIILKTVVTCDGTSTNYHTYIKNRRVYLVLEN
jgi:hypothetical protein